MIKGKFKISMGAGIVEVPGFVGQFLGANVDRARDEWSVTMLHTGTTVNSLFADIIKCSQHRQTPDELIAAIDRLEAVAAMHFYCLFDLAWGATNFGPDHLGPINAIREAAKA